MQQPAPPRSAGLARHGPEDARRRLRSSGLCAESRSRPGAASPPQAKRRAKIWARRDASPTDPASTNGSISIAPPAASPRRSMCSSMAEPGCAAAPRKPRCIAEADGRRRRARGDHRFHQCRPNQRRSDADGRAGRPRHRLGLDNAESFGGDRDRFLSRPIRPARILPPARCRAAGANNNLPADFCKGALLVGGMYDLEPVRRSARSAYVKFTDEMEEALSPQRHIDGINTPLSHRPRHLRDAGIPASIARLFHRAQGWGKNG